MSAFAGNRAWTAALPAEGLIEASVLGFVRETGRLRASPDVLGEAAGRIARELLPFEPELAALGVDRLTVIPEGVLTRLPFEALRTADDRAFLVERYAVSYATSPAAPDLPCPEQAPADLRLLAVGACEPVRPGGRIPGARREIECLARLFARGERRVYLDREASESNLRKHRGEWFQVVHIASHGRPDGRAPGLSELVLAGNPGDDGDLRAEEITALGWGAELVVLSACRTSLGLPPAFLRAGARSVLATLWPVPDEATADFMAAFYRRLGSGLGKCRALQAAKLETIRGGRPQPFFWAGYVLLGDPEGTIAFR